MLLNLVQDGEISPEGTVVKLRENIVSNPWLLSSKTFQVEKNQNKQTNNQKHIFFPLQVL